MEIVGINSDMSSPIDGVADRYLRLDIAPDNDWIRLFGTTHQNYFSTSKRRARIEGAYIVVTCSLDEIQTQINLLNEQVDQTNKAYDALLEERRKAEEDAIKRQNEQREKANNVFSGLQFGKK